jgi:hypothetical protein
LKKPKILASLGNRRTMPSTTSVSAVEQLSHPGAVRFGKTDGAIAPVTV